MHFTGDASDNLIKQVLPPFVVGAAHQSHDMAAGMEIEGARLAHELHACLGGRLVSFAAIARMAAGDEILPRRRAAARTGYHVIERKFPGRQNFRAVLAGIAVAQKNILSGQRASLVRNAAVLEQPNHGRDAKCQARGVQIVAILFLRHSNALQHEDDGSSSSANVDGLIGSIQDENRRMQGMSVAVMSHDHRWRQVGVPASPVIHRIVLRSRHMTYSGVRRSGGKSLILLGELVGCPHGFRL
jgi:hypothetical protein